MRLRKSCSRILFFMGKILIYTCITGGYDTLKIPLRDPGADLLCFSDSPAPVGTPWKLAPIPDELRNLNSVKQQRVVKICPHRYLPTGYDISIWVDGSITICGDVDKFAEKYDLDKTPLYTRPHPKRDCVYEEAEAIVSLGKDIRANVDPVIARYREESYPEHAGLAETCILLRRHADRKCALFGEAWAAELMLGSHRDQLSFNYVAWKTDFSPGYMFDMPSVNGSECFRLSRHA